MRTFVALDFEHRIERFEPLLRFLRIDVRSDVVHIHGYTFVALVGLVAPGDEAPSVLARHRLPGFLWTDYNIGDAAAFR